MSASVNVSAQTGPGPKLKVFVSYSRKDATFADELVSGLELCGFEAFLDKHDIAPGEPWEKRLNRLIRDADTVVFVLSPSSVASEHCGWEVAETVRLSKRLMPIVWQQVPADEVPKQLGEPNWIDFTEEHSFLKNLSQLANALRTDLEWVRQHTRFSELAANWEERGRSPNLLLLAGETENAKAWMIRRPKDAPQITIQQQAFIDASIRAEEEAQTRDAAQQRRGKVLAIALAVVGGIGTVAVGAAWWQAERAVNNLLEANLRLSRKIALKVAPSGDATYYVGPNWYQIASDYSGAIAIVRPKPGPQQFVATGFIVRGSELYPPWGHEAVFVTLSRIISHEHPSNALVPIRPEEARVSFPGLEEKNASINLGEILWERPVEEQGVTVLRIKGSLPFGAKVIANVRHQEFEQLPDFDPRNPASISAAMQKTSTQPLATIGFGGSSGFALMLNNLLGIAKRDSDGKPLQLGYTYVTEGGVSGSPVFDVETSDLVAIHTIRFSDKVGGGVSIVSVINAIRRDLAQPN